ncbi:MAG: hypothetical protein GW938_03670 [Leptospira sp.]|nr:hypothetical protein [Leptospira sp.]NCS92783.1 hypothetical protein [Leptospira sp.]
MNVFRIILLLMTIAILTITLIVGLNHGWDLLTIFFSDIMALTWPGQFNFDFMCFLILSGLWVAWRNNFSTGGITLGLLASVAGIMFLAPYLLFLSYRSEGDMKVILLGESRTS